VTLEAIIRQLEWRLDTEPSVWVRRVEEINPDDKDSLREVNADLRVIMAYRGIAVNAVLTRIVGRNRLTPSLFTRGWVFWRSPLVTEKEEKAIGAALRRFTEGLTARNELKGLPFSMGRSQLLLVASVCDRDASCIRRLCADLKQVLDAAAEE